MCYNFEMRYIFGKNFPHIIYEVENYARKFKKWKKKFH